MLDYRLGRSLVVLSSTFAEFNALFCQCAPTPRLRRFNVSGYGNINPLSIDYAFQPRLRP